MWWYYKCVNLVRVLIQGSKVILCVTWKCLARAAVQAGLRPVPTLWLDQPPLGMSKKNGLFKTTRERRALPLFFWCSDSLEHGLNISETPRSCALQRAPVRWTLTLKTNHLWSLRPCQSRKITEQLIQRLRESRESRELSRWRHAAEVSPKEHEPTTWNPKQRTHAGKRNQRIQPALNQQKASNKPTFLILTKPLKFDLNAVTKQRFVRDLFPG